MKNLPIHYQEQKNEWMDCDIVREWFHGVFMSSAKEHLREKGLLPDRKVALLLDDCCSSHLPAEELNVENICVMFLPPGITSLIQLMDQGVSHPEYKDELLLPFYVSVCELLRQCPRFSETVHIGRQCIYCVICLEGYKEHYFVSPFA